MKRTSRIDWPAARKDSQSIQDFVDSLIEIVKTYPANQRAELLLEVIRDISPTLEPNVTREADILVSRGYQPLDALKAALLVALKNRRARLFHWLFYRRLPEHVNEVMTQIEKEPTLAGQMRLGQLVVKSYTSIPLKPFDPKQGAARLREANLPEAAITALVKSRRLTQAEVLRNIDSRIQRGELPVDVVRDELNKLTSNFAVHFLMSQGVAEGPDFCIFTAVVAIIGIVVGAAVTIGTTVSSAQQKAEAEARIRAAQDIATQMVNSADRTEAIYMSARDLSEEELRQVAAVAVDGGLAWPEAVQLLKDKLRNERERETPTSTEMSRFITLYGQYSAERASAVLGAEYTQQIAQEYAAAAARVEQEKRINLVTAGLAAVGVIGGLAYVAKK